MKNTQTLDQILMDMYVDALKEGMLKPRHISEAKQAIKQSLLANMPEKKTWPERDEIGARVDVRNRTIDDCIKAIEEVLK